MPGLNPGVTRLGVYSIIYMSRSRYHSFAGPRLSDPVVRMEFSDGAFTESGRWKLTSSMMDRPFPRHQRCWALLKRVAF